MKKIIKNLIFMALMGCMAFSTVVYAQTLNVCGIKIIDSVYLFEGYVEISKVSGGVNIDIDTTAYTDVEHIYHDVTVYKNGVWISSERYEGWNRDELNTNIRLAAKSGDYIDVYVDHYTDNLGYLEVMHSSENLTY